MAEKEPSRLHDVSSGFQYQPLDFKNDEIRLIEAYRCGFPDDKVCRVACRLFHTQLSSATAFHVLSYRWGDSVSARKIAVNGRHLSASANLEAALWNLQHSQSPLVLWLTLSVSIKTISMSGTNRTGWEDEINLQACSDSPYLD